MNRITHGNEQEGREGALPVECAALASITDGVVVSDTDDQVTVLNRAAARMLGADPGTALGQSVGALFEPFSPRGRLTVVEAMMRLQADPTVQYAIPGEPRRLLYRDYEYPSVYNTYIHKGLPPGPVNNPGRASIEAAVTPAEVDYLYFVANGQGRHIFSHSLEEHNQVVQRLRQRN